eukprot:602539-Hanusia_phi.AAC.1
MFETDAPMHEYVVAAWAEEISLLKLLRKYKVPGADKVLEEMRALLNNLSKILLERNQMKHTERYNHGLNQEITKIESEVWKLFDHSTGSPVLPSFDNMASLEVSIEEDSHISGSQRDELLDKIRVTRQKAMQLYFTAISHNIDDGIRSFHHMVLEQTPDDIDG